jgi:hypothetical protein
MTKANDGKHNRSHYKTNGTEKHAYNSMREAMAQARIIQAKQGEPMSAYQCAECHLWHVGHTDNSGIAARTNDEILSTQQKDIGYVVKPVPSLPTRPVLAPTNQFMDAAAKLDRISQEITTKETEIKRLAELTKALLSQIAEMKGEAQSVMNGMSRAFANTAGAS